MKVTKGQVLGYFVLPGILPRIGALFGSGFSYFSYFLAYIYFNVGLLPRGHLYLKPSNFGRFGVRHVVAEAAQNLVYTRKNLDKILVFYSIFIGVIILCLQFLMMMLAFVFNPVFAGSFFQVFNLTDITGSVIDITRYRQDIAFVVLDRIFGIRSFTGTETFFRSCLSAVGTCQNINGGTVPMPAVPNAFHNSLHRLFEFYSMGIAFISTVMLMYCVVAIVGETVVTGTPFGKRFNKAWFVPRLILFFAMIMPMNLSATGSSNTGINMAQFVTLGAAKYGSNMATNAWNRFADVLISEERSLIAKPNVPEISQLTQFMFIVRMCMLAEMILNNKIVYPYIVRELNMFGDIITAATSGIPVTSNVLLYSPGAFTGAPALAASTFRQAVAFSRYGTVTIRFGELNLPDIVDMGLVKGEHSSYSGYVEPTCGELVFNIDSTDPFIIGGTIGAPPASGMLPYSIGGGTTVRGVQENYFDMIMTYLDNDVYTDETAYCMLEAIFPYDHDIDCLSTNIVSPRTATNMNTKWPRLTGLAEQVRVYDMLNRQNLTGDYINAGGVLINNIVGSIIGDFRNIYTAYGLPPAIRERGWAGAALWYSKIAEINGMVYSGAKNIPVPYLYPMVMEEVARQHKTQDSNYIDSDKFNPLLQSGRLASLRNQGDQYKAAAFYSAYNFWNTGQPAVTPHNKPSGNALIDAVNLLLGTNGILDIRENRGVHPLAMLSSLGKGMVDSALQNLFYGGVGLTLGGALDKLMPGLNSVSRSIGSFYMRIATIGFSVGFILYYVLPLMPFIYFFFAFSGWIKSIFEAMVAMPLWALAHIKIDGNGLPGPFASNGYFLLLEIFVRPTLIIFGFISSISVFAAMVDILHISFSEYILNAGGTNVEKMIASPATHLFDFIVGPLDELFYTVFYVILVYMIGVSCFKLIDLIPAHIMRWMGVTVSTFREDKGDAAGELQSRMFSSSQMGMSQLEGMLSRTANSMNNLTNMQILQQGMHKPPS